MTEATKATRRSASTVALIASAADLGYNTRAGFQTAVASASKLVPSNYLALVEAKDERAKAFTVTIQVFGDQYKAGHVVAYLEPHYGAKRWGNMDRAARVESAVEILAKPEPTSDKSNRRTELEHKACRAAIAAWSHLKGEAGLKRQTASKVNRKGASKRRAAGDEKTVPTAALTPPKFGPASTPVDVVSYWDRLSSDMLNKAVNANAAATPIGIKSAVQDFRKAVRAAVAAVKAGQTRTAKAKATKGTVSAATIASRMQNGTGKPNGASVN